MAQSVRRPPSLGAKNHEPKRDKSRISYFGNVKSRMGSKLPPGVSQPPHFAKPPWETQHQACVTLESTVGTQRLDPPTVGRPLNHIPHIRNPKLRQYYLQGTSWDLNTTTVRQEPIAARSDDSMSNRGLNRDTLFGMSSQLNSNSHSHSHTSALITTEQLLVPRGKNKTDSRVPSSLEQKQDSCPKETSDMDRNDVDALPGPPHSPSPEAEYDKLLDVDTFPLPDGQLCLLALPPECCQGEGPGAVPYLKLFCRYITDRKGVVSGILLVTSNKIFFDPCKTLAVVKEHGCEEYLLSCSVDSLASVSFFSDISQVHFSTSQQRRKGKKFLQKLRTTKILSRYPDHKGESPPALVSATSLDMSSLALSLTKEVCGHEEEAEGRDRAAAERELDRSPPELLSEGSVSGLGVAVLSSAASFCCGGQETTGRVMQQTEVQGKLNVKSQSTGSTGSLMFVRLRAQSSAGKKLGSTKTLPRRDAWLALSQESADELCSYLTHYRPDLCILEGEREEEDGVTDRVEEEFVLIEGKEEEGEVEEEDDDNDEVFQRHRGPGDDWEMVLMEENGDKAALVLDRDPEGLCHIVEKSQILEASHVKELSKELPPRTVSRTWQLVYSTSRHGSSLKSLYRKLSGTDSPVLIVIKDALDEVFGAFLSHPLRPSETFYGTGETFLFMLHPRFKCFKWTGENSFFIKGDLDSFAIGGGSGHFGLWLDENLYLGRSSPCYTFNNCCLSETDDFRVMELEIWTFN
ncbi:oxidation resistance protein 1 isoform X3 [Cynoglossus semilaevis]|uniref:oxidation resistance protein 1 isoform X3 n=1 Tax=Cynoglossus semilaevis TaxID=244447 RepID=UPI0007DCAADD|nr:oxidation resistance protein 1-like isoform X3 [Cynoglossus semilaevis]